MLSSDPAFDAGSIAEVLLKRAAQTPNAPAYCFLIDGEEQGPWLSYGQLDQQARSVAAALQKVADPGDRALLLFAPGLAFIAAFFGCQYAGVVPVPTYPPQPGRIGSCWETLDRIAQDCSPRVILADRAVAPFIPTTGAIPALTGRPLIVTEDLDLIGGREWREPRIANEWLALLQYTSGSTAEPKGVMVSHANMMDNQRVILTALEHYRHIGIGVNWLPPYHDLGLIGGILQTVYRGASLVLMSPLAFLQNPLNWVKAISHYRADTSGAPNFAYDLCVERSTAEERAALDLSNWSVAAIGSEPVNPDTMERFSAAFAPAKFRHESFYPCYGLAEATVFVAGGARTAPPVIRHVDLATLEQGQAVSSSPDSTHERRLVGCGRAWLANEICIVDPDSRRLRHEGLVGEIWVRGPSVAQGYWNRPDETDKTFHANLEDAGVGPFLRSGDLGFMDHGELFITGRIKDVVVIRGRNYYPQDIEGSVQALHAGLRAGCGAAFEVVRDGQARLVIVQEVDRRSRDLDEVAIIGDIRQSVAERHELQAFDIVLVQPGTIPKTSSGKVRRSTCRTEYECGSLKRWKGRQIPQQPM